MMGYNSACEYHLLHRVTWSLKTNYGSETAIILKLTCCREKIYFNSAIDVKQCRLIHAIYFLTTNDDLNSYDYLRTAISPLSGFVLMLFTLTENLMNSKDQFI